MKDPFAVAEKYLDDQKKEAKEPEAVKARNARARAELDRFFIGDILPRLSRLYTAGRLPDLTQDTLWTAMEAEWLKAASDSPVACDVVNVKELMRRAVKKWEGGPSNDAKLI